MLFITFGNFQFFHSAQSLKKDASKLGIFRRSFTPKFEQEFIDAHANFILSNGRGYGYWLWKSYLIMRGLEECEPGENLLYADAGCSFGTNTGRILDWAKMASEDPGGILAFQLQENCFEHIWTKQDTIRAILPDVKNDLQLCGTVIMFTNTQKVRDFVKEWFEWCIKDNYHYLTDAPSRVPELPCFIDHRHDQSIFSLLAKKYNILTIKDETYPPYFDNAVRAIRQQH